MTPSGSKTYNAAWLAARPGYNTAASSRHRAKLAVRLTGRKKPKTCAVCRRRGQPIHYDHCHKTGLFRGWLCRDCNAVLGYVRDSPRLLRRLADYLEAVREPSEALAELQRAHARKLEHYFREKRPK